ncbi:hypothetical protein [Rickettsia endosymbiont of Polydrusus tereticollis]|uniref:hypothetical protein n=1 Tax=Rickettsia endosymbiont of Polydrusus tereticollis TaxID=3066251 RepID=UPI003133382C
MSPISHAISGLDTRCGKMKKYYDPEQEMESRLINTFKAMQEYKPSNDLAQLHNEDALNAIKHHEGDEDVEKKKFGISIEIFPSISFTPRTGDTLGRFDCYNSTDNILKVCPNDLPYDKGIPTRSPPKSLFAHELAHAIDDIANKDNPSVKGVELTIRKYFPKIDATNADKVRTALENAAMLYDKEFNDSYGVRGIIDKSYNLNFELGGATDGAAHEFVSFFAQSVSECLNDLKEGKDFSAAYGEHIQGQIDKIYPPEDKLFALDVMSNCSQAYVSRFTNPEVQKLFQDVNKVIEEKRNELTATEKQLEGSTVTPSTPKASKKEKEPNPTLAEDEAKAEKVTQELIEKIQKGEVKAVAIDLTKNFTTWDERVSDAAATKNKALDKNNKILVIDKNNEKRIRQVEQKGLHVTIFNPYLNQHLTRTEKENIIHFMPQGELNEKGKYNLNDRLAAVNDNQGLLDKLDREAAITANIDIKAIDAKKSVEAEKTGTVEIRAEHNHSTEHGSNNQALIAEIQSGTIDKNTVIAIERKQYGENQGMKDIIKIASILEHNEKNPGNPLKLPEKLENTLIFQDALLYKTAKEKGIKVISLEGRNLEHTKESALYNENREQYMTDVINEVRGKGYNVIANVGSSHVANLEKALESRQKHEAGFSNIPRKIGQGSSANNQRESTGFSHISEGILQKASAIAKKIPAGRVSTKSVGESNISQRQSSTNTQLKKSGQGRG